MTPLQYRRWYDFARRMALRTFDGITPARRLKIAKKVRHVLWCLESDVPDIVDWDNSPSYVCDAVDSLLSEHDHYRTKANGDEEPFGNRFHNQVTCCIRAGLDMASAPSAGVLGWSVGDLRKMYPLGIPEWITAGFNPPITSETPDDTGVWL
ncbi:hypothetical protein [Methylorubrum sp. SB2]|uniref:hypothetical protein n=1 Tax=Methylorubrum subtropicum TaxID=3138812 RepID=UPI00313C1A23